MGLLAESTRPLIRDLGALEVDTGREVVRLAAPRLAATLSRLVVENGRRVGADALIDAVWGEDSRQDHRRALEAQVWRLRQVLEVGRDAGRPPRILVHDHGGYRLATGECELESDRFAAQVEQVGSLLRAGRAAEALALAEATAALWRGDPYPGISDRDWARPARVRLDELYGRLRLQLVDGLLATGQAERALVELKPVLAGSPLTERPWEQAIVAAYRCGRIDEALGIYATVRALFADEMGLVPGPALVELHRRVLVRDPDLLTLPGPSAPPPEVSRGPGVSRCADTGSADTHPEPRPCLGRDVELEQLDVLLDALRPAGGLVTVCGPPGVGRSHLARSAAARVAARFPGGVRLLDLAGTALDTTAPDTTAPHTTAPHTTAPDTTAPVTTGTDDADTRRRVEAAMAAGPSGRSLVLVDHAEPVLDVVAEVLDEALTRERHGPPTARPAVLAVSREPLGVTGERLSWLSPLPVRPGNPGARPAAAVLLADRLARVVPEQHLDEERWGVVEQVAAALDGLPLALELAAARARSYTLEEILVQVRADAASLAPVGRGPHRPRHSLHEAVDAGVRLLDPRCRALHAVLAVVSGPFPAELAAALLDAPRGEVAQLLGQLVHCSLLSVLRSGDGARDSSFVQLTAVRAHAARALDPAVAAQARARRDAWLADPRAAHGTHTDARPRSEGRA